MLHLTRWLMPALMLAWLLGSELALAQQGKAPPRTVIDNAGLFPKETIMKADMVIADIQKKFGKEVLIETLPDVGKQAKDVDLKNAAEKRRFFRKLAEEKAEQYRLNGVYVLITTGPGHVEVVAGEKTVRSGLFTKQNEHVLAEKIAERLEKKQFASALLDAVQYPQTTMAEHGRAARLEGQANPKIDTPGGESKRAEMPPWVGWVCLGIVALLVIWVIFGVIRAVTGGARGGAGGGYGGGGGAPGYGGGGGGGGGGFLSSLVGGMFGAAAGMWAYNHFFSGGTPTAHGADMGNPGGTVPPTDVGGTYNSGGSADWDSGAAEGAGKGDGGGGADWGDGGDAGNKGGGGDFGGGGGDWGGGGDAGGGGADWGGGGGDFGGGGGDAGGGGGGDW